MSGKDLRLRNFIDRKTIALAIAAAIAVTSFTLYFIDLSHRFFIGLMGEQLKYVVSDLATNLDADAHSVITSESDIDSESYKSLTAILEEEQRLKPDIRSAYTLRIIDGKVHFIISPPFDMNRDGIISGELERRDPIGLLYEIAPPNEMLGAAQGIATAGNEFVKDRWGTWLSACAPLKKTDGVIDGAVCVDADGTPMIRHMMFVDIVAALMDLIITMLLVVSVLAFMHALKELEARKAAEKALADARSLFDALFEHAPLIAIQSYDINGRVRLWNSASEELYGIKREDAVGRNVEQLLLDQEQSDEMKSEIEKMIRTRTASTPREWQIKTRTGSEINVLSTMFPTVDEEGNVEIFCMDIDISREKVSRIDLERQIQRFKTLQESLLAREGRLIEMKKEVNELLARLNEPPKYVV